MSVDLNELKTGDSIELRGDGVYHVTGVEQYDNMYTVFFGKNYADEFRRDGKQGLKSQAIKDGNIIKVIKQAQQKQWTDDDMKKAFEVGTEFTTDLDRPPFYSWIEQYKAGKK
jgi:hypothetical protein